MSKHKRYESGIADEWLYDLVLQETDETLGVGTYASRNVGNPTPGVQAAISRWKTRLLERMLS
jgi:hypothetical protein